MTIISRIERLVTLAANNPESNEARNAAVKACQLIREHKIELKDPTQVTVAMHMPIPRAVENTFMDVLFGNANVARDSVKAAVLRYITDCEPDGCTCDEIEEKLSLPHQTVSPRVYDLIRENKVRRMRKTMKTRSGKRATILRTKKPVPPVPTSLFEVEGEVPQSLFDPDIDDEDDDE